MSVKTTLSPDKTTHRIKSFVKRAGRLSQQQKDAITQHWPHFGRNLSDGMIDLTQIKQPNIVLEIGFGMGKSLRQMAIDDPNTHFIGIEVHRPGVGTLLHEAANAGLNNLSIYCDDAIDILTHCIPDHSLNKVQLFFPDPWPKKRHHKRRIVQADFVEHIRQKLVPGGILHIATDWGNYAEHILAVMQAASGYYNTASDNSYAPRPDNRPLTKYEQRGQRLGHGVWDILFKSAQNHQEASA